MPGPTFGVEEEFFLADADTGAIREDSTAIQEHAKQLLDEDVATELRTAQVETGTAVCENTDAVRRELRRHRSLTAAAAADSGARVLATGSHPTARASTVGFVADDRYQRMADRFGRLADEALVCGCHVHVQVPSREVGVAVIDRIGRWLAPLTALSANSPLWQGADTGYDSWRCQVWSRWPTAGPTSRFGDLASYDARADALIESGAAVDRGMLYYDARLSEQFPTVEVRVADVCRDIDDAVLIAALVRALVVTAIRRIDEPADTSPLELRRAAAFAASRSGLRGKLLDPVDGSPRLAAAVIDRLLDHVTDALENLGDVELARDGVARLLRDGTAAARQRAAWHSGGAGAVLDLVAVDGG
jgi:glutamate---cysteine ligase / carboxylate-amine ligase